MNGWLPESFEQTPGLADRIASGVKARNIRRKKLVREAWAGLGGAAAVAIVAVLVVTWPSSDGLSSRGAIYEGHLTRDRVDVAPIQVPPDSGLGNTSQVKPRNDAITAPTSHPVASPQRAPDTGSCGSTPDLTLSRVDHSVEVAWQGKKNGEYVVYRCTSPKFDQCSLADRVKGTKWVDSAPDANKITFYRVEPKG